MSRRLLLPLALVALLSGAGVALADANGSSETRTVTRSCGANMSDNQYSTPQGGDCRNADGSYNPGKTYQATHWTNDVRCGSSNAVGPATPTGVRVYASQGGGVGTCSEGGSLPVAVPVQGRAGVTGGTNGAKVVIDGDKDNAAPNNNETLRGWAAVEAKPQPAPPTVTCGDEYSQGGRGDSDAPQARDNQAECGS